MTHGTEVGVVSQIWRYPVKSMAGEQLEEAEVSWHGLAGDRRWGFVRDGLERSGFPYLTIRELSHMAGYRPVVHDPSRPDRSAVSVVTPSGDTYEVTDPRLVEELGGRVRVIKLDRGLFDVAPLSVISHQSIASLQALVGRELDHRRFRPNLLIAAAQDEPWPEDQWVGATLRIGQARVRIDCRDDRCVVVCVDPATGERDARLLRTIVREPESYLGVYGATVAPGTVSVGDAVILERA
ncbi:MAG: MOSC domain-containing protein [Solirubrobacteraceae bacterium]